MYSLYVILCYTLYSIFLDHGTATLSPFLVLPSSVLRTVAVAAVIAFAGLSKAACSR